MESLGKGFVRPFPGLGQGAGGGTERQPGSLVQVPSMPFNLFAALGKSLNHSEPIHIV